MDQESCGSIEISTLVLSYSSDREQLEPLQIIPSSTYYYHMKDGLQVRVNLSQATGTSTKHYVSLISFMTHFHIIL
jgi:hypothetical protein